MLVLISTLALNAAALPAAVSDLFVDATAACSSGTGAPSAPFCTVTEAIAASLSGDVIRISPGFYVETLVIPHALSIIGVEGDDATTLHGAGANSVLGISPGVSLYLEGVTIARGLDSYTTNWGAGGILSLGSLTMVDSTVRDCERRNYAGGIFHYGPQSGELIVRGCRFFRNTGASIFASSSSVLIEDSSFYNNRSGNGITSLHASIRIDGCSFYDNQNGGAVGAVGGFLGMSNSTVSRNGGCGVNVRELSPNQASYVRHVTIVDNVRPMSFSLPADSAGGISATFLHASSNLEVTASIIARNLYGPTPQDIDGDRLVSGGNNLVGVHQGPVFVNGSLGDLVGNPGLMIPPGVAALGDNGGSTLTHALLDGSLAIGTGPAISAEPFDQRGLPRSPMESDIGAVRRSLGDAPSACAGNPNSTGAVGQVFGLGSALAADNQFELQLAALPPASIAMGIVSMTSGVTMNPGGSSGDLCLAGAIGRFVGTGQLATTDAAGLATIAVDLAAVPQPLGPLAVLPGSTWYFQAWHRDLSPTGATSNFTRSVRLTFS